MEKKYTFVVSGVALDRGDVERVADILVRELKDMVWREVWRDEIELPGMVIESGLREDGRYWVEARIDRGSGEWAAVPTEDGVTG